MRIEKLREMNREELQRKLDEFQDNLFKLKVKVQTKQIENTAQLSGLRRDIARIKTLLYEMDRKGIRTTAAAETGAS
ncbi:50S ribosomal protein L29 [candidate division FCPU426 bacterium]|nr:50S ribosomal protein L29 [candidate division FCPU426 bacterium]